MPLCPELYKRLKDRFVHVDIANEGQAFQDRYRKIGYEVRHEILHPGEYYKINCPFCGDNRKRLWVNHRFSDFRHLAVCYNETRCLSGQAGKESRADLYKMIFGNMQPVRLPVNQGTIVDVDSPLAEVTLPGEVSLLTELPANHPALTYLSGRRYDCAELTRNYGIGYCHSVYDKRFYPLKDRIFIPVFMNSKLVGWQGRYVGDVDWKARRLQKYFNLKGMSKARIMYNFDQARQHDVIALVEGVADVWRVGPASMAVLGSYLNDGQKHMILKHLHNKKIAVFMDGAAVKENSDIVNILKPYLGSNVFTVPCPVKDPGDMTTEECWRLIHEAARTSQ